MPMTTRGGAVVTLLGFAMLMVAADTAMAQLPAAIAAPDAKPTVTCTRWAHRFTSAKPAATASSSGPSVNQSRR